MNHPKQAAVRRTLMLYAVTCLSLLLLSILFSPPPAELEQPYDSGEYLRLSHAFLRDGRFSFAHYPESIRGYLYPLLLFLFRNLLPFLNENQCVLVMNCMSMAAFLVLGSQMAEKSLKRSMLPMIALALLVLAFWLDLLTYALTDFYAFFWLLLAVLLVEKVRLVDSPSGEGRGRFAAYGLLSGMLAYAAYNARPNLSFSLAALLVYLLFRMSRNARGYGMFFPAFCAGAIILALPQMFINHAHLGRLSPLVPTDNYQGQSLMLFYLNNGLTMRRYETFVGDRSIRRWGEMIFENSAMARLLTTDGITSFSRLTDYFLFVIRHPFECMAVYTEHIVNLLTPIFGQIYVTDFYGPKVPRILLHFGMYALVIMDWMQRWHEGWKPVNQMHSKGVLAPVIISLVSVLPVIAGKVETRYALAIYLFVYMDVCWYVDFKRVWRGLRKRPFTAIFGLSLALMLYFTILSNTFSSHVGPLLRLL